MTGPSKDASNFDGPQPRQQRGPTAALSVVIGGVLAFLVAGNAIGLVRETLHFNCSWGIGGEWGVDGSWTCGDGIGSLGVAVPLGGMSGLLVIVGVLTAIAAPSRGRSLTYITLAAASIAWMGWWTFYGATVYAGPRPPGETGAGLWAATVLPGLGLCILGLFVGGFGALERRRWSLAALACGVGLLLVGTALQPGIGVATLVSAGLLAAAGFRRERVR